MTISQPFCARFFDTHQNIFEFLPFYFFLHLDTKNWPRTNKVEIIEQLLSCKIVVGRLVLVHGMLCGFGACENVGSRRCAKCKLVYYCSKGCQTDDWAKHKPICCALLSVEKHRENSAVVLKEFAEIKQHYDARKFLTFPSMEYSSQRVEIIHAQLRYSYNKAHEQEALQLCDYFCNAYLTVGYLQRGLAWGLRGLKTASQFDTPNGDVHLKVGDTYSLLGLYEKAESHYTQSMLIFVQADEKWLLIRATTRMGANYNVQGYYEKAENTLQSAVTMAHGGLDLISCTMAEMGIASEVYLEIATYQTGLFRYTAATASLNLQYTIIEKLQKEYVVLHGHDLSNSHDFTWCEMRVGGLL